MKKLFVSCIGERLRGLGGAAWQEGGWGGLALCAKTSRLHCARPALPAPRCPPRKLGPRTPGRKESR